ncbi:unnamed protein product [Linum trigynum]|uniref:Uncharacterized protein n=1 Tax=Linum trigynum TaxID=586398 RepID=A0AAV2FYS8_9ROSI
MAMLIRLQNTRNATVVISYEGPYSDLFTWAESMELLCPVVVTLTSISVTKAKTKSSFSLRSTPATRIVYGSYTNRCKYIIDRFYQDHFPVMVLPLQAKPETEYLRQSIPPQVMLTRLARLVECDDLAVYNQRVFLFLAKIDHVLPYEDIIDFSKDPCFAQSSVVLT